MKERKPAASDEREGQSVRTRIIQATFQVLMERGYRGASTREIARRAKVSKRELYALFENKEGILAAMIGGRAARMRQPLELPEVADRQGFAKVLTEFGVALLREGSERAVSALTRLAIAEAERAPELAKRLDRDGRRPTHAALEDFLAHACDRGLIGGGDARTMAVQFLSLLWGDLQMALLLRLAQPPPPAEIERRADAAVAALLALYPVSHQSAR